MPGPSSRSVAGATSHSATRSTSRASTPRETTPSWANPALNESYPIYGEQVTAAGAGRVIATRNDLPDNTPVGTLPQPVTLDNAAGNYVVQSLPGRRYALYAHFQPGTVRVAPGDRVQAGQVLGLVGNSGNSDEARLHFHLANRPALFAANGRPHVFSAFRFDGHVRNLEKRLTHPRAACAAAQAHRPAAPAPATSSPSPRRSREKCAWVAVDLSEALHRRHARDRRHDRCCVDRRLGGPRRPRFSGHLAHSSLTGSVSLGRLGGCADAFFRASFLACFSSRRSTSLRSRLSFAIVVFLLAVDAILSSRWFSSRRLDDAQALCAPSSNGRRGPRLTLGRELQRRPPVAL